MGSILTPRIKLLKISAQSPPFRIERVARQEKPVTADTALRLGKFFKTGAAFWMNIQARFDLEMAEEVLAPEIKKIASYEARESDAPITVSARLSGSNV